MRHLTKIEKFRSRPPIDEEQSEFSVQLRVVYRLIQLRYNRTPQMAQSPEPYLRTLNHELGCIPGLGMLAFWLMAIRNRPGSPSVMNTLIDMYADVADGVPFRRIAFPGYKQSRNYAPRGRGNRQ